LVFCGRKIFLTVNRSSRIETNFLQNLSTGVDKFVLIETTVSYRQHPQVYEHRREIFFRAKLIFA